jgi:hypothetical protein
MMALAEFNPRPNPIASQSNPGQNATEQQNRSAPMTPAPRRKVREGRHDVEQPLAAVMGKLNFLQQDFGAAATISCD